MRKILLISLLLILCLAAAVLAQEAAETETTTAAAEPTESTEVTEEAMDETTEKEVAIMHGKGAAMRVLQLRRAILQHVISGKEIVAYLSEKGESVPELTAIIDELVILEGETKLLNTQAEGVVKEFVNIKRDANQLTKEFRTNVKPLVTGEDRKTLGERIKTARENNAHLAALKKEIEALRQQVNIERVQQLSTKLGIADPSLLEKLQAGTITKEEIHAELKNKLNAFSPEERKAARMKIKEWRNEDQTKRMLLKEEMKTKHLAIRKERLQKRWSKLSPEKKLFAKKRFDEHLARLDRVALMKAKIRDARADTKIMKDKFKEQRELTKEQKDKNEETSEDTEEVE